MGEPETVMKLNCRAYAYMLRVAAHDHLKPLLKENVLNVLNNPSTLHNTSIASRLVAMDEHRDSLSTAMKLMNVVERLEDLPEETTVAVIVRPMVDPKEGGEEDGDE